MNISIITVFPEIHASFLKLSLIGRALERGSIKVNLVRFSDFCTPKSRIDQPTCGPGAGMIIKPEVVEKAIAHCEEQWGPGFKIFFSPQGNKLSQPGLRSLAKKLFEGTMERPLDAHPEEVRSTISKGHIILVCPRYEGMDARVESFYADLVISIGDYVLMGGDLPAQVLLEGLLRLVPGIVGDWDSVQNDSFSGPFLDHPEYGLPVEWKGQQIPDVVRSGNHALLAQWRTEQACKKTIMQRFDWFRSAEPTAQQRTLAQSFIPNHYVALMHTDVNLKGGFVGTTSITSIDIHDTSRSCATYGIKNFFIVSPLVDQQAIMKTFLDFWHTDIGKDYNESRYQAISRVKPTNTLEEVLLAITRQEGKEPLIIITSAKNHAHAKKIGYFDQGQVWQHERPVLFLFGTGQGLADYVVDRSDFLLVPVTGMTDYNHLSVRSAMAIVLDRWLGLNPRLE